MRSGLPARALNCTGSLLANTWRLPAKSREGTWPWSLAVAHRVASPISAAEGFSWASSGAAASRIASTVPAESQRQDGAHLLRF